MERPKLSKIGAWASPQSQVIQSRNELEQLVEKFQKEFEQKELGRPPFWGGYKLKYESIEFWQGRQGRLHDRFLYTKKLGSWEICRLAPNYLLMFIFFTNSFAFFSLGRITDWQ